MEFLYGIEFVWPEGHTVQDADVLCALESLCSTAEQLQQQGWRQPAASADICSSSMSSGRITRSTAAAAAVSAGTSACTVSDACHLAGNDTSSSRSSSRNRSHPHNAQQSGSLGELAPLHKRHQSSSSSTLSVITACRCPLPMAMYLIKAKVYFAVAASMLFVTMQ